jgi:outer membrane protein assembly factor BamB
VTINGSKSFFVRRGATALIVLILVGMFSQVALSAQGAPGLPAPAWSKTIANPVEAIYSLADLRYLLLEGKSTFHLLDAADGTIRWEKPVPERHASFLVKESSTLLVVRGKQTQMINPITGGESVIEGRIKAPLYHAATDSVLAVVDDSAFVLFGAKDGRLRWKVPLSNRLGDVVNYHCDPDTGTCLILANSGRKACLVSLDVNEGVVRWETLLPGAVMEPLADCGVRPLIHEGGVYVELGGLSKLNLKTGALEWHTGYGTFEPRSLFLGNAVVTGHNAPPVIQGSDIFTAAKGRIRRIDTSNGKVLWESKDYDITPLLSLHGDSVVAVTGGIFRAIVRVMTGRQFLLALAVGVAIAASTGYRVIPMFQKEIRPAKDRQTSDIENLDLKAVQSSIMRIGKPGVVVCDAATGKERFQFRGAGALSGAALDFPVFWMSDAKAVYRIDLRNNPAATQPKQLFQIKGTQLGDGLGYFIRQTDREALLIALDARGFGHLVPHAARLNLEDGRLLWETTIGENRRPSNDVNFFPVILAEQGTFLAWGSTVVALDSTRGKVTWSARLPDRGWSLYPHKNALVYYDPKERKVNFHKLPAE